MVALNALLRTAHVHLKERIYQGLITPSISVGPIVRKNLHTGSSHFQEASASLKPFRLSFTDYIKLKGSVRTKQRIASVPFAFMGMSLSSLSLAYAYPDMFDATPENVQLILGLDPLVFSGISGVVAAGLGYIVGNGVYKLLWRTINKDDWENLDARDRDFLQRLDKHRFGVDSKFEDDYYGESIKTLSDYRQWVRTQQRKRENHAKYNTPIKANLD